MNNPSPLVDNSDRTARYSALMDERRGALRKQLGRILPTGAEFVWELGSGHGHFLTAYAQAHPEKLCVGIDIVSERVERALRKRERAKLPNLHFVRAEARLFLETLPPSAQLTDAFVLFPDPWPKVRHHKHRILQPAFLDLAATRAAANCGLYFRTDFAPYFLEASAAIRDHPRWALVDEPWPFESETVFQNRAGKYHSLVARIRL